MNDWYAAGGELFNWYLWSSTTYDTQYGTWYYRIVILITASRGITDDITNFTTPKAIALFTVASSPLPQVTGGHILPGSVKGGDRIHAPDSSGFWRVRKYLVFD